MSQKKLLIAAVCVGLLVSLFFISIPAVTITAQGKRVKVLFYKDHTDFSIRWRHSVEKEDWEEIFAVSDGTIKIDSTRFKTFGAGVPSHAGKDTYIKDGWVYMTGIDRVIGKELVIGTGLDTRHRFIHRRKVFPFNKKETAYTIKLERLTVYQSIYYYLDHLMR